MALEAGKEGAGLLLSTPAPTQEESRSAHLRGKRVILAFYPGRLAAPSASDQLHHPYSGAPFPSSAGTAPRFMGISGGRSVVPCGVRQHRNLRFPLLADLRAQGEVARAYDVYRRKDALQRAGAVSSSDREGIIRSELRVADRHQSWRRWDSRWHSRAWKGRSHDLEAAGRTPTNSRAGHPDCAPSELVEYGDSNARSAAGLLLR